MFHIMWLYMYVRNMCTNCKSVKLYFRGLSVTTSCMSREFFPDQIYFSLIKFSMFLYRNGKKSFNLLMDILLSSTTGYY